MRYSASCFKSATAELVNVTSDLDISRKLSYFNRGFIIDLTLDYSQSDITLWGLKHLTTIALQDIKSTGGSMTVKPLQDRVLIKRLEEETKTAGGIIIPDNHKEKPAQGEVIAVGTGYRLQDGSVKALEVKKGDKVLFGKYSGTEVKVAGETFVIMKEEEIFGIFQ